MSDHSPERSPRFRLALRSASAAGLLAIVACSPALPTEPAVSPIADVPSSARSCEVPQWPACESTPSVPNTEPSVPATTPPQSRTPAKKASPSGFVCNWMDEDGKRQPLVSDDDVIVKVDGRCRKPDPLAPINIHANPDLKGPVVDTVQNGDELVAKCAMQGVTSFIDARGPRSASRTVLWVETPNGQRGFVSELSVGYVDDTQLRINGTLPSCDFGS